MLHPVGGLAPSVYWRRRALLIAALVLLVVTVYAVFFRGGGDNPPKSTSAFSSSNNNSTSASRTTPPPTTSSSAASASKSVAPTATAAAKACVASQLTVRAATDKTSYPAGAKPTVALVVTDRGTKPCVADLSDSKIELRVYNGSARVWGSHDCAIAPGTSLVTLPVGQQTRRNIEWSGLSSQPGCATVRTRVPAGNYTLYAYLAGQVGATAKFSMAG